MYWTINSLQQWSYGFKGDFTLSVGITLGFTRCITRLDVGALDVSLREELWGAWLAKLVLLIPRDAAALIMWLPSLCSHTPRRTKESCELEREWRYNMSIDYCSSRENGVWGAAWRAAAGPGRGKGGLAWNVAEAKGVDTPFCLTLLSASCRSLGNSRWPPLLRTHGSERCTGEVLHKCGGERFPGALGSPSHARVLRKQDRTESFKRRSGESDAIYMDIFLIICVFSWGKLTLNEHCMASLVVGKSPP